MKKTIIFLLLSIFGFSLFALDLFTEESKARNFSFTSQSALSVFPHDETVAPSLEVGLTMEQNSSRYQAKIDLLFDSLDAQLYANEVSISLFFGPMVFKTGLYKEQWGSASASHVVDILNSRDMRGGLVDDLEAMKRPDYMVSLTNYWASSSLQLVLKPGFFPTYLTTEGRYSLLPGAFSSVKINEADTHAITDFTIAARYAFHGTFFDAGLIAYSGKSGDPGFTNITLDPSTFQPTALDLVYTRFQFYGGEASLLAGPFTFAFEGGYAESEDTTGTDAGLYNSKWIYLAELSYTNPQTNLFASFTYQGRYVLDFPSNPLDVDVLASVDGKANDDILIIAVEVPMLRETLKMRLAGTYAVESKGYAILGSLSYALDDNLELLLKTTIYGEMENKTSLYSMWDANDSVLIGLKAWF
ncbi:MAG: hypothetical protein AB7C91_03155 [Sphaerochaeta sp.]|jgi:hypothetical protein|uniref:hypothetical protein n=1 Tax=Sphaerochaeta sp. TaxID=1972642 RepID=UPI003D0E43AE